MDVAGWAEKNGIQRNEVVITQDAKQGKKMVDSDCEKNRVIISGN